MNRSTPLVIFVVVLLAAGLSFVWFVEQTNSSGQNYSGTYNSTKVIVLYANAAGWDANSSNPNPTLYEKTHVLLEFKIIEQDTQPHTFTVNPGSKESQANEVFSVNIPAVQGTVVWLNWSFANPGAYDYWCIVHPETMNGSLVINSSSSNGSSASAVSPLTTQVSNTLSLTNSVSNQVLLRDADEQIW